MLHTSSRIHLLSATLALASLVMMRPAAALSWTNTVIDDSDDTSIGIISKIALDSGGRPHIAYVDQTNGLLKYAYQDATGAWRVQTLDASNAPGLGLSLEIDDADQLHLSYYTAGYGAPGVVPPGDLVYATRVCWRLFSFTLCWWQRETVAFGIHTPSAITDTTSLALGLDGRPNIAYLDRSRNKLRWARKTANGAWTMGDVASGIVGNVSMAIDDAGFPQFAYRESQAVRHARIMCVFIFCGFNYTTVDTGDPGNIRLAGGNQPRLVYNGAAGVGYAEGLCEAGTPCTWRTESLGLRGLSLPQLRLDAFENPHLAFIANSNGGFGELYYARRRFGSLQPEVVSVDASSQYIGLALDSAGYPQISFQVFSSSALGHARGRNPFSWVPPRTGYLLAP